MRSKRLTKPVMGTPDSQYPADTLPPRHDVRAANPGNMASSSLVSDKARLNRTLPSVWRKMPLDQPGVNFSARVPGCPWPPSEESDAVPAHSNPARTPPSPHYASPRLLRVRLPHSQ